LPVSAFLLTLGSFLTAGLAPSEVRIRPSLVALVLAWVGLVLPLAASARSSKKSSPLGAGLALASTRVDPRVSRVVNITRGVHALLPSGLLA